MASVYTILKFHDPGIQYERLQKYGGKVGLDHGVGHPLLLLYDVKAPNGQKSNEFNDLNHYPSSTS
jgi:hypothetical protein